LPQFSDVKMFVDALIIEYQANRTIEYELERNVMACTPFHADYLYSELLTLSIDYR
jgi:hypothetical protein